MPEASEDLTARLLARTGQLAAERAAAERTAERSGNKQPRQLRRCSYSSYTCGTFSAGTGHGGTPDRPAQRKYWTQRNGRARRTPPGPAIVRGRQTGSRQDTPCRIGQGPRDRSPGHAAAAHPHRARRRGPRLPVLAVGGAVAALALMTGTAYVMGGDDAVPAEGAETATLAHPDAPGLPASGEPLGATELFDASGSGRPRR